jgi:hypothetical protein
MLNQKKHFIIIVGIILTIGFLITSFASFFVSRSSLRSQIENDSLPLTSDNIYSEIQRDLLQPVFISSLMATDTFLRDWVLAGEQDELKIRKYLREIQTRYNTFTSFFISEKTRIYYHSDKILKKVDPDEERDVWYFRVREMQPDYEINVDPDMANSDTMTVFVNYKVFDYEGNFIGATGVGLTIDFVKRLVSEYQQKYNRKIYFIDRDGTVIHLFRTVRGDNEHIREMEGLSSIADSILTSGRSSYTFTRQGRKVHLNVRYIPELSWFLMVEQPEADIVRHILNALIANLMICVVIVLIIALLINFTVNAYRKKLDKMDEEDRKLKAINLGQQEAIANQNKDLLEKNSRLQDALAEVKKLSGLLPICASCKNIRDDKGYWKKIESYIQEHSEAQFSHGICPECFRKMHPEEYGEIYPEENDRED